MYVDIAKLKRNGSKCTDKHVKHLASFINFNIKFIYYFCVFLGGAFVGVDVCKLCFQCK